MIGWDGANLQWWTPSKPVTLATEEDGTALRDILLLGEDQKDAMEAYELLLNHFHVREARMCRIEETTHAGGCSAVPKTRVELTFGVLVPERFPVSAYLSGAAMDVDCDGCNARKQVSIKFKGPTNPDVPYIPPVFLVRMLRQGGNVRHAVDFDLEFQIGTIGLALSSCILHFPSGNGGHYVCLIRQVDHPHLIWWVNDLTVIRFQALAQVDRMLRRSQWHTTVAKSVVALSYVRKDAQLDIDLLEWIRGEQANAVVASPLSTSSAPTAASPVPTSSAATAASPVPSTSAATAASPAPSTSATGQVQPPRQGKGKPKKKGTNNSTAPGSTDAEARVALDPVRKELYSMFQGFFAYFRRLKEIIEGALNAQTDRPHVAGDSLEMFVMDIGDVRRTTFKDAVRALVFLERVIYLTRDLNPHLFENVQPFPESRLEMPDNNNERDGPPLLECANVVSALLHKLELLQKVKPTGKSFKKTKKAPAGESSSPQPENPAGESPNAQHEITVVDVSANPGEGSRAHHFEDTKFAKHACERVAVLLCCMFSTVSEQPRQRNMTPYAGLSGVQFVFNYYTIAGFLLQTLVNDENVIAVFGSVPAFVTLCQQLVLFLNEIRQCHNQVLEFIMRYAAYEPNDGALFNILIQACIGDKKGNPQLEKVLFAVLGLLIPDKTRMNHKTRKAILDHIGLHEDAMQFFEEARLRMRYPVLALSGATLHELARGVAFTTYLGLYQANLELYLTRSICCFHFRALLLGLGVPKRFVLFVQKRIFVARGWMEDFEDTETGDGGEEDESDEADFDFYGEEQHAALKECASYKVWNLPDVIGEYVSAATKPRDPDILRRCILIADTIGPMLDFVDKAADKKATPSVLHILHIQVLANTIAAQAPQRPEGPPPPPTKVKVFNQDKIARKATRGPRDPALGQRQNKTSKSHSYSGMWHMMMAAKQDKARAKEAVEERRQKALSECGSDKEVRAQKEKAFREQEAADEAARRAQWRQDNGRLAQGFVHNAEVEQHEDEVIARNIADVQFKLPAAIDLEKIKGLFSVFPDDDSRWRPALKQHYFVPQCSKHPVHFQLSPFDTRTILRRRLLAAEKEKKGSTAQPPTDTTTPTATRPKTTRMSKATPVPKTIGGADDFGEESDDDDDSDYDPGAKRKTPSKRASTSRSRAKHPDANAVNPDAAAEPVTDAAKPKHKKSEIPIPDVSSDAMFFSGAVIQTHIAKHAKDTAETRAFLRDNPIYYPVQHSETLRHDPRVQDMSPQPLQILYDGYSASVLLLRVSRRDFQPMRAAKDNANPAGATPTGATAATPTGANPATPTAATPAPSGPDSGASASSASGTAAGASTSVPSGTPAGADPAGIVPGAPAGSGVAPAAPVPGPSPQLPKPTSGGETNAPAVKRNRLPEGKRYEHGDGLGVPYPLDLSRYGAGNKGNSKFFLHNISRSGDLGKYISRDQPVGALDIGIHNAITMERFLAGWVLDENLNFKWPDDADEGKGAKGYDSKYHFTMYTSPQLRHATWQDGFESAMRTLNKVEAVSTLVNTLNENSWLHSKDTTLSLKDGLKRTKLLMEASMELSDQYVENGYLRLARKAHRCKASGTKRAANMLAEIVYKGLIPPDEYEEGT